MSTIPLTVVGAEALRKELHEMKTIQRPAVIAAIAEARSHGDLSENAEYDAAKEAQGLLEMKISKLKTTIANCRILDESQLDTTKVTIFSKVKVKNLKMNNEMEYTLVSEKEQNFKELKISVKSAIGAGLLGKKVGDIAKIQVPAGLIELEILELGR